MDIYSLMYDTDVLLLCSNRTFFNVPTRSRSYVGTGCDSSSIVLGYFAGRICFFCLVVGFSQWFEVGVAQTPVHQSGFRMSWTNFLTACESIFEASFFGAFSEVVRSDVVFTHTTTTTK